MHDVLLECNGRKPGNTYFIRNDHTGGNTVYFPGEAFLCFMKNNVFSRIFRVPGRYCTYTANTAEGCRSMLFVALHVQIYRYCRVSDGVSDYTANARSVKVPGGHA